MSTLVTDQPDKINTTGWRNQIRRPWSARRHRITRTERALIVAHGKALTMLVTALQARGHLDVEEFANTLGIFSAIVAEDNTLEGDILGLWALTMKDSLSRAEVQNRKSALAPLRLRTSSLAAF